MDCLHKTVDFFNKLGCCFGCKEEGNQVRTVFKHEDILFKIGRNFHVY